MNNIERIRAEVKSSGYEAILLTSPINRLFATGFMSSAGVVVISVHDACFFTDSRYEEAARNIIKNARVTLVTKQDKYTDLINEFLIANNIKVLGFEEKSVLYPEYRVWSEKLTAKLEPMSKVIESLRAVKSRDNLSQLIKAQRIAEKSFEEILPLIKADITERELAAELVYRFMKNGADDKSFDPIIVSAERSSMPHGVPGDNKIKPGFLTMDFGVRLGGWCSDTTRTVCVGEPDGEMIKVYETVLKAQEMGIRYAKAGVKGCDIDSAARKVIEDAGYGEYFGHGFGHGLGLEVHEPPNASPAYKEEIPSGAVISAEPGIYLPGRFGVRIEDVIYITDNGCDNITNLTKKMIIL